MACRPPLAAVGARLETANGGTSRRTTLTECARVRGLTRVTDSRGRVLCAVCVCAPCSRLCPAPCDRVRTLGERSCRLSETMSRSVARRSTGLRATESSDRSDLLRSIQAASVCSWPVLVSALPALALAAGSARVCSPSCDKDAFRSRGGAQCDRQNEVEPPVSHRLVSEFAVLRADEPPLDNLATNDCGVLQGLSGGCTTRISGSAERLRTTTSSAHARADRGNTLLFSPRCSASGTANSLRTTARTSDGAHSRLSSTTALRKRFTATQDRTGEDGGRDLGPTRMDRRKGGRPRNLVFRPDAQLETHCTLVRQAQVLG